MHATLANIEPATALPTKHKFLATAVALLSCFTTFASFTNRTGLFGHWKRVPGLSLFVSVCAATAWFRDAQRNRKFCIPHLLFGF
jgi:hypothetical protein